MNLSCVSVHMHVHCSQRPAESTEYPESRVTHSVTLEEKQVTFTAIDISDPRNLTLKSRLSVRRSTYVKLDTKVKLVNYK